MTGDQIKKAVIGAGAVLVAVWIVLLIYTIVVPG